MTINHPHESLLHIARPRECNTQQPPQNRATSSATSTQQPSLKAASLLVLERNKQRNKHALSSQKSAQQATSKIEASATSSDRDNGLTLAELKEAAGEDWPGIKDDPKVIESLAHAIQTRRMREHGEIPPHYTSTAICKQCGPVPIFPGGPETVLGCPWCFNRVKGLPVPNRCVGYEPRPGLSRAEAERLALADYGGKHGN